MCIIYPWNSDEPLLGPNHVSSKGRPQGLETQVGRKQIFLSRAGDQQIHNPLNLNHK